jgi:hypothetical protein
MKPKTALIIAVLLATGPVRAQHDLHTQHHSPYANQDSTGISSLSRQELDGLLQGAGMGYARPAELNQYPGPKHVLELAQELELSDMQASEIEAIRVEMLQKAKHLGGQIVEKERHLDRRFAHRHIDEATLRDLTAEIARLYGELRFAHLQAHLETREVLSGLQVETYDRLRGYTSGAAPTD